MASSLCARVEIRNPSVSHSSSRLSRASDHTPDSSPYEQIVSDRHPRRLTRSTRRRRPVDGPSSSARRPRDDDATTLARTRPPKKHPTHASRAFARLRVSRVAFARVPEHPNRIPARMRERARSDARARARGRDELATRTGERRHDDIEEKKIPARARAFVRSRVAFVRARACVTTTTAREGNRKGRAVDGGTETRRMCVVVHSHIHRYTTRYPDVRPTDT